MWLKLAEPFIHAAYEKQVKEITAKLQADYDSGQRKTKPSDKEIAQLALRSLYLFPKVNACGSLDFSASITSDSASKLLGELKADAGFAERSFTWHGIVSGIGLRLTFLCVN